MTGVISADLTASFLGLADLPKAKKLMLEIDLRGGGVDEPTPVIPAEAARAERPADEDWVSRCFLYAEDAI
jgi:hypothetical protein